MLWLFFFRIVMTILDVMTHALVSFKKYMVPPLSYFKVNIYPSPLHLNIFRLFVILLLTQLYRYTPEIFLFSTAAFEYNYRAPSDKFDKNSQRTWLSENLSHWNGYSHFRSGLNLFRKFKKRCFKNQMSVIWSWTYFYIICIGTIRVPIKCETK